MTVTAKSDTNVLRSAHIDASGRRPRLGFLGVGWIGRHRMNALLQADVAEIVALCDSDEAACDAAMQLVPDAASVASLDDLLEQDVDGIVIATPSALHAEQAITALRSGCAVFCQKPLARTAEETREVVEAARQADQLLGVDFTYRHVPGARGMRRLIRSGELGELFAINLTFHNAYGPDKAWFRDPLLSGGGCVIDLGIHLVDLTGWTTGRWEFEGVQSTLFHRGKLISDSRQMVEDAAFAQWRQPDGATVRLACSWNLPAGQDAVIEACFYGTEGAACLRNIEGSFFNFVCEHYVGTQRRLVESVCDAPDPLAESGATTWDVWAGGALVDWARRLSRKEGFNPAIESAVPVASLLDAIYGRSVELDQRGISGGSQERHAAADRSLSVT